ncbi:MAG: alpha/beta hydrolase [Leptospirales bacterium]
MKKKQKNIKKILIRIILIVLFLAGAWLTKESLRTSSTADIEGENSIATIETLDIGNIKQQMMFRGVDSSNPVLLILHGGPGMPLIGYSRHVTEKLENHFVVVSWEQRGAGKLYDQDIPLETMNIEQFVVDTIEVIEYLKNRFGVSSVYVCGLSWGAIVGPMTASRRPDLVKAYIGVGQMTNVLESELLGYNMMLEKAEEAGNEEALKELKEIGTPPYKSLEDFMNSRKWLGEFGNKFDATMQGLVVSYLLGASEYTFFESLRVPGAIEFSLNHLFKEVFAVNLFETVPRLDVPVYLLMGKDDTIIFGSVAERYFNSLIAPKGKTLIWFEGGHYFNHQYKTEFQDALIDRVLAETTEIKNPDESNNSKHTKASSRLD